MPRQSSTSIGLGKAPLRIAGLYASFGLLWIWLSDWLLMWLGYTESHPLLASAVKGTAFVMVTAMLLHWLVRREIAVAEKSETLLRAVVDGTTDAVFVKDSDGRYLLANEAAARFIGKPVNEVLGRDDRQLFGTADAERLISNDRATMAGGKVVNHEETITSGGRTRTYHATKAPFRDATGAITGLIGVSRDITERKSIEDALRLSEQQYRELANAIPQIVWSASSDGAVTNLNSKALEYTGLKVADLSGWSWQQVIHADDRSHAVSEWSNALKDSVPRTFEMRIRRWDGEYRWHIVRELPIRDAAGEIESWVGTCTDIEDLRLVENTLRETETRLREAQRIARLGSWNWEPDTDKVIWSEAEFELFGVNRDEMQPSFEAFLSLLHPDDQRIAISRVEALKAGSNEFANDMRVIRPDGVCIWIHSRARASRDADGRIVRVEGTDQDITARRLAELAAQESEKQLQAAVEVAGLGIIAVDYAARAVDMSHRAAEQFGFTPGAPVTKEDLQERIHPDDRAELKRLTENARRGADTGWFAQEHRVIRPDGTTRWLHVRKQVAFDEGQPSRSVIVTFDVTERKRSEEALRASEARYRLLFESNPHPMWVYHTETLRFLAVNDAAVLAYGYSREEFLSMSIRDIRPPEEVPRLEAAIARVSRGTTTSSPWLHKRKDGTVFTVEVASHDLPDDGGRCRLLMALDITDRVAATEALQISEERLRVALKGARGGVWDWDLKSGNVWWSPEVYELMGAREDMDTREARAIEMVYENDRSKVQSAIADAIARRVDYHCEFRVQDGARWLSSNARLFCNSDGEPVRLLGITWDISDRMQAMEALRESEMRYRRLIAVLPTAVLVHDGQQVLYSNPAFVRLVGAESADEVVGRRAIDFVSTSDRTLVQARMLEMLATGEAVSGTEIRLARLDGRSIPAYSVSTPVTGYGPAAFLVAITDLTDKERATQLLRSVLSSVGDAILTIDERGIIGSANQAARRQFGYTEEELIGQNVSLLMNEPFSQEHDGYLFSYLKTGVAKIIGIGREVECRRHDGSRFSADLTVTEFSLEGERRFTGVLRDITERKRLQSQFIQAQKMEAVGRLAGGVAHDFNNLLTIISGYCELLLMSDLPVGDKRRDSIATIRDAGERAARLTQQLLAFSRKAVIEPKLIDLNELVTDSARLLRRLIGEDIILAVVTAPKPIPIKADPGQFEQVIMNLVVNARDAMLTGGRLTIETSVISAADASKPLFACLSVSDTGQGVSDEVKEKIFEPFFTTKSVGQGTGLGLAVVHGVVTQSGGQITIESSVGVGTTFRIMLPIATDSTTNLGVEPARSATRGSETILLVEDDHAVRRITRISLQSQGYTVLEASDGLAGLHQAETYQGEVHLLISDVVMPEMGGRQLLDAVRKYRPALRVLFMSGYTDDAVLLHGVVEATDAFIQKPFTPLSLARKVREVIDAT